MYGRDRLDALHGNPERGDWGNHARHASTACVETECQCVSKDRTNCDVPARHHVSLFSSCFRYPSVEAKLLISGFIASCARLSILFSTDPSTFSNSTWNSSHTRHPRLHPSTSASYIPSLDDMDHQRTSKLQYSSLRPHPPSNLHPHPAILLLHPESQTQLQAIHLVFQGHLAKGFARSKIQPGFWTVYKKHPSHWAFESDDSEVGSGSGRRLLDRCRGLPS